MWNIKEILTWVRNGRGTYTKGNAVIYIDKTAQIGEGTLIGDKVVIGENVIIGTNCYIRGGAFIEDYASLANEVSIGVSAIIGIHAKIGEKASIGNYACIEGYNVVSPGACVTQIRVTQNKTEDHVMKEYNSIIQRETDEKTLVLNSLLPFSNPDGEVFRDSLGRTVLIEIAPTLELSNFSLRKVKVGDRYYIHLVK